jgi:DNA-binding LacI/PurR family transcriptional regulator
MHGLIALGIQIPGQVRIVGIDDIAYASLLPVPLTTMRQPCHEIGLAAMSTMLERIHHPAQAIRDVLLQSNLIVRASCGAKEGA